MAQDYTRIYNAARARTGNADPEKSFHAFQVNAGLTRRAIALAKEAFKKDTEHLREIYAPKKADELYKESKAFLDQAVDYAKHDLEANLQEVLDSKRQQLRKVSKAPSEEDLRLLQTLKMRTKLTQDDVTAAAEALGDNLPALALLRDIAAESKITVPVYTIGELEQQIDNAEEFSRSMIADLEKDDNRLSYTAYEFYFAPDAEVGLCHEIYSGLDNNTFTSQQLQKTISIDFDPGAVIDAAKTPNAIEVTLFGRERLPNLLLQFYTNRETVQALNPSLDLNNLHSGDRLIMPGGKMKTTTVDGYAKLSQCSPVYCEYAVKPSDKAVKGEKAEQHGSSDK